MTISFIAPRHYLIAAVRYILKDIPKDFTNLLNEYESLGDELPSPTFNSRFNRYCRMHQLLTRYKLYQPINALRALFGFNSSFATRHKSIIRLIFNWIERTQKVQTVARQLFLDHMKIQKANIFGPLVDNNLHDCVNQQWDLKFVIPIVQEAAKEIWTKRDWCELPILADMCEDAGCTDVRILDYLRNLSLHKHLRFHCWVLQPIIQAQVNKDNCIWTYNPGTSIERW